MCHKRTSCLGRYLIDERGLHRVNFLDGRHGPLVDAELEISGEQRVVEASYRLPPEPDEAAGETYSKGGQGE